MDPQAGSTWVVPVVLPLLHGPQNRRRLSADSTLAGDRAARGGDSEALRTGRSRMSEAPAAGRPSLGIRQPKDMSACPGATRLRQGFGEAGCSDLLADYPRKSPGNTSAAGGAMKRQRRALS